jgi:hypothetical protein
MDVISISILAFSTVFCAVYRETGNPVFLSMLLTYILMLNDFALWTVKCFAMIE